MSDIHYPHAMRGLTMATWASTTLLVLALHLYHRARGLVSVLAH